jgi:glycerophosphoryl diester phosphodiesterase
MFIKKGILSLCWLLLLAGCISSQSPEKVVKEQLPSFQFEQVENAKAAFRWKPDQAVMISAHRGGPMPGYPENCVETFEHTLSIAPAILEVDIELTKDSVLILMHDQSLDRTTTGTGKVQSKSWEEIKGLKLVDNEGKNTEYKVPTLLDALEWTKGRTMLSLDIKRSVPFEMVVDMIEETGTESSVMVITYSAGAAKKIHRLNPDLLLSVSIRNEEELDRMLESGIPTENMVAFTGTRTKKKSFYDKVHAQGITCILGTLGNLDKQAAARGNQFYQRYRELGIDIFATDRPEAVAETFYQ